MTKNCLLCDLWQFQPLQFDRGEMQSTTSLRESMKSEQSKLNRLNLKVFESIQSFSLTPLLSLATLPPRTRSFLLFLFSLFFFPFAFFHLNQ